MKKSIGIIGLLLLGFTLAQAQSNEEKIEAMRAAVFTRVLDLTPEESRSFWPLFDEYENKRKALREQYSFDKKLEFMTDAEAENFIKNSFELEEKELNLKQEYYQKMRSVLPVRKIARIAQAERTFQQRLIEILKARQENRQRRFGN